MNELQIGLLGLGVTAVVGVLAYNKWQEYRHRKLAEEVLSLRHADVLLDEAAVDAPVGGDQVSAPEVVIDPLEFTAPPVAVEPEIGENTATPALPSGRIEPVMRFEEQPSTEPKRSAAEKRAVSPPEPIPARQADETKDVREVHEPLHLLSPLVDYVVALDAVEPAPAYQILDSQRDVLARIHKPIHWVGYNEYSREWEPIVDDGKSEYRRIRVGLQLVDRQGPIGDNDLSVFHMAVQDLADELMAIADFPTRQSVLQTAAKLDEFCASVDIQIGINVISQGVAFPGTKLRALAEAAGMVVDEEGRFVRRDDDGNVLFVLLNQESPGFSMESIKAMTTHGLTFLLDVPRVAHGERVFNQMVDLARRFAEVLRGALVDDNRRPLSEGALEPIRRQVGQFQSMMAARNLPAGGPLTRRLFS